MAERAVLTADSLEKAIKEFVRESPLNRMPDDPRQPIFEEPLVRYASGDDVLFVQYKTVIAPDHLTPREALGYASGRKPEEMPPLSVISWILPVAARTRQTNRQEKLKPSRLWSNTRWYGEQFNDALRKHVVDMLTAAGHLACAPVLGQAFKQPRNERGFYSTWSERHVAYVAGQGTFSLSDGFITDRGIAHRCGSVVTDMALPASPRTAATAFSNCLFYADASCRACIKRCPAGAITEAGHDKDKCRQYQVTQFAAMREEMKVGNTGCGLCQVKVPCEQSVPRRKTG